MDQIAEQLEVREKLIEVRTFTFFSTFTYQSLFLIEKQGKRAEAQRP